MMVVFYSPPLRDAHARSSDYNARVNANKGRS